LPHLLHLGNDYEDSRNGMKERLLLPGKAWRKRRIFFGLVLILLALTSAIISFVILIGMTNLVPDRDVTLTLIFVNGGMVVGLIAIIIGELYPLIVARRARRAASRLHIRIVTLFSLVACIPALIIAIIAGITLNLGLDRWFDSNTRQIVGSSVSLANAYASATLQSLQATSYSMALQLDNPRLMRLNPSEYRRQLTLHAAGRDLRGVFLLDRKGQVLFSSERGGEDGLPIPPTQWIGEATETRPVQFQPGNHDYFGVILQMHNLSETWLYAVRDIDSSVLEALRLTEINTNNYREMEASRFVAQIAFATLYFCLVLIMLLSAIWTALAVADRLVHPIRLLIDAADDVASGNMEVMVPVRARDGDVGQLAKTFNYMIQELRNQRNELIGLHGMSDERRRFIETVLSGVSAAVIGVDAQGLVTVTNRSAQAMFDFDATAITGQSLVHIHAEIGQVFEAALDTDKKKHRTQLILNQKGRARVYDVQVTKEAGKEAKEEEREAYSFVVTIDDITDLVEAQRSSAWADVARRIAHEIKNPLTPIQLSAERLRRRYGKMIDEGREVFDQCVDTIIRQVGDIGRMVDEFSSFARMPKPTLTPTDLRPILQESCFLVEISKHHVGLVRDFGDAPLIGAFDGRLIGQAFANIIKNASEAIEARLVKEQEAGESQDLVLGRILVKARMQNDMIIVDVMDNGIGLPSEQRQKLLEPYMTTREKGTGLGLAIVRKIVEEHGGVLELHDAPVEFSSQGAMIRMRFPIINKAG